MARVSPGAVSGTVHPFLRIAAASLQPLSRAAVVLARLLVCLQLSTFAVAGWWRPATPSADWPLLAWLRADTRLALTAYACALCLLAAGCYQWYHTRARGGTRSGAWAAAALAVAALLGLAWWSVPGAVAPGVARAAAGRLSFAVASGVLAWLVRPKAAEAATALALALCVQAGVAIGQFSLQSSLGLSALGEVQGLNAYTAGVSVVDTGTRHWMRAYGLSAHPNVLGGFLAVGLLVLLGALAARPQRRALVILWCGSIVLGLVALLLTFSRSAWIGFALGCLVMGLWYRRHAVRVRRLRSTHVVLITALLLLLAAAVGLRDLLFARLLAGASDLEARSLAERVQYAGMALRLMLDYPWHGVGLENFALAVQRALGRTSLQIGFPYVHNVALMAGAELGAGGLLAWLALGAVGLLGLWHLLRGRLVQAWSAAWLAVWLALYAIAMFDYYPWSSLRNFTAWPVLLAMCLAWWPSPERNER